MFCPKCGNVLPDTASFCNKCGSPTGVGGDGTVVSDGSDRHTKAARIIVTAVIAVALVAVIAFVVSYFVLGTTPQRFASRTETYYENLLTAEDDDKAEKIAKKYWRYYFNRMTDDELDEAMDWWDEDNKKDLIEARVDSAVENVYEWYEDYLEDVEVEVKVEVGDELKRSEIGDLEDYLDDIGREVDIKEAVWIEVKVTLVAEDDIDDLDLEDGEDLDVIDNEEWACLYKSGGRWHVAWYTGY